MPDITYSPIVDFENIEPVFESQIKNKKTLSIRKLTKSYGDRTIVEDMNLDIFEGQIFALLGHNGSGKTTTISMITGMTQPSEGEVIYGRNSLKENIDGLRQNFGVCFQQDVLFPLLTPYEHLKIFSKFKGVSINDKTILEKLLEVRLLESKDKLSKDLSGGQKRKLCLAIALLGNSKIVILDEPTSGMDVNSRRYVWDLLKNNRAGRIIILTTHYMEEADILADRIAVLVRGCIKCCGSPLYLKTQYGSGYTLTLGKTGKYSNATSTSKIIHFMGRNLKDFVLINDQNNEISFQIPSDFISRSLEFFEELDKQKPKLGVKSYSISATTLEEVFIKILKNRCSMESGEGNKQDLEENEEESQRVDRFSTQDCWALLFGIIKKRFLGTVRDYKNTLVDFAVPFILVISSYFIVLFGMFNSAVTTHTMSSSWYPEGLIMTSYGISAHLNLTHKSQEAPFGHFKDLLYNTTDPLIYSALQLDFENLYNTSVLYPSPKVKHSASVFYHDFSNTLLKSFNKSTVAKIQPFPLTKRLLELTSSYNAILTTIGLGLGFSFIPTGVLVFISQENRTGIKSLHVISGMSLLTYWLGNFIWDCFKQNILFMFLILTIKLMQFDYLKGDHDYSTASLLLWQFSMTSIFFSYFLSFLFKTSASAHLNSLKINFFTGSIVPCLVLTMMYYEISRKAAWVFIWIFRIFPNFSLNWGLINVSNKNFLASLNNSSSSSELSLSSAGGDLLMLFISEILYFFLVILCEYLETHPALLSFSTKKSAIFPVTPFRDEEIEKEAKEAQNPPSSVQVNIQNLQKIFKTKKLTHFAIENLSLNIRKGEYFALLGVNGAGKSTTFKILTGQISQTKGDVFINGLNTRTSMGLIKKDMGYCPQTDSLNHFLTARETLSIYADIKGIPKLLQKEFIAKVISLVGLEQHADFQCGHYSGGNKRKLSLAISLLGLPSVVILDEPTVGMDPESRREIWKILFEVKKSKCCVLMTSHSMEEAECLCDRAGIMVGGRLKCLGSISQIKEQYGGDIEVQLRLESPNRDVINDLISKHGKNDYLTLNMIKDIFELKGLDRFFQLIHPNRSGSKIFFDLEKFGIVSSFEVFYWVLSEEDNERIKDFFYNQFDDVNEEEDYLRYFKIKIGRREGESIGKIFQLIEDSKKELKIIGYSLTQTSLDQIFNRFARGEGKSDYKKKMFYSVPV